MRTTISLRKTWWGFFALVALTAALAVGLPAMLAQGADHLDAPLVQNDGRLDINDVYAFQSPTNPDNTVFIMTVNPLAGILSPTAFHPKAEYQFLIDNDGDGKRDMKFKVKFSKEKNGQQEVKVNGHGVKGKGKTGENIFLKKGGTLRAGVFDDPFFFDLVAFQNALDLLKGCRTKAGFEAEILEKRQVSFEAHMVCHPHDIGTERLPVVLRWYSPPADVTRL